ncbi:hypothetical protein GDO86_010318 [Hymenochirus boettgeri]|uniref:Uncharacterized protein n=1 Tax=Hymenochirus boettgeri TaxID=247094 RepID=A0A8T2JJS6_9PIPI|nr:hypothetical protein GDO86_010318 [Hymenochirus boettgeri]
MFQRHSMCSPATYLQGYSAYVLKTHCFTQSRAHKLFMKTILRLYCNDHYDCKTVTCLHLFIVKLKSLASYVFVLCKFTKPQEYNKVVGWSVHRGMYVV